MVTRRPGYERRRKELRYLKTAQPGYESRVDNTEVREHIRFLQSYGWTMAEISDKAGASRGGAWEIFNRPTSFADTAAAFLGVKLNSFDREWGPGLTTWGRKLGAHRITTGLYACGWSGPSISAQVPHWGAECIRRYSQTPVEGTRSYISKERYIELRQLAQRLETLDPIKDGGCIPKSSALARARARGQGHPPIHCWDLETVHFPDSRPEWTGACGTEEGYRIHIRETLSGTPMPPCDACRATVEVFEPNGSFRVMLDRPRLEQALAESPHTISYVAGEVFGDVKRGRDVLYRWRDGTRSPRYMGQVGKLAEVLGVHVDVLVDESATEERRDAATPGKGDFNPHVLRTVLDMSSMSQCAAAKLPGCTVTKGSINTWVQGKSRPQTKAKIQFLADHFGIDVETFYS